MHAFIKNHKLLIYISLLTLIGGFFRFYNMTWGSPFYFHPDERNIAASVSQLHFPSQMNPNFFAYGSFPIYVIYATEFVFNLFLKPHDLFIQATIISRFYSAVLSLLIIPSIYFIGKKLGNKYVGLFAAIFCALSVGLIQFAHFGTFEMWLTFLGIWFFYFSLKLIKNISSKNITIVGAIFGLLVATKISALPLLALPFIGIAFNLLAESKANKLGLIILKTFIKLIILMFSSLTIFAIFSPYVFLDSNSFLSSMRYESSVAFGTLPVFYTGEFFGSIPVLFQFTKIYPFLINPILTILFIFSFIYVFIVGLKKKNYSYLILDTCYLILFLPQAFLFAKWTRYIVPTLPFTYLIIAITIEDFLKKNVLSIKYSVLSSLVLINIIFATSYFITVFIKPDTRIEASIWAEKNIPRESIVLSEVYDMGILPFNQGLPNISLFNFYDLDQTPNTKSLELKNALEQNKYLILPSQRILQARILNPNKFPTGNNFYKELADNKSYYEKIYQTQCDIFCKITYLGDPVFRFEQTSNVFDRPTVFIFKKI